MTILDWMTTNILLMILLQSHITVIIEKDYDRSYKNIEYKKWGLAKDDVSPQGVL